MRWFVEISPLGSKAGPSTTLCVEAPQWQPALQKARALRGDNGGLNNFSIELLDDGFRAIDPMTRLRYVVKRAPDDAALQDGSGAAAAPVAAVEAKKPVAVAAPPVVVAAPEAKQPAVAPREEQPPAKPASTPPAVEEGPALPSFILVGSREENPTDSSPLTYRELVFAVAADTSEEDARRLLLDRFDHVRATLDPARRGKFINLAVFDHVFHGKPQRRPLVTLAWKDWKAGEPEIRFPAREAAAGQRPSAVSSVPPSVRPVPEPAPEASEPVPMVARRSAPADAPAGLGARAVDPALVAQAFDRGPDEPAPPRVRPTPKPGVTLNSAKPVALPKAVPLPEVPVVAAPQPVKVPAPAMAEPVPAPVKVEPVKAEPVKVAKPAAAVEAAPETRPVPTVASAGASQAEAAPRRRLSGDDLLTDLFEAFADLHFLHDSLAGAEFVLGVTMERLPFEIGLVSLFDMNRREFVVVRQLGGAGSAVGARMPDRAPLARTAMRKRHALVVTDPLAASRATDERFRAAGVELKSLLCAPVELAGRYLGIIELGNPLDGVGFNDGDGNALTYIGQQYAEFVASRGVIIDPAQLREPSPPRAEPQRAR